MIEIKDLSKTYNDQRVVDDLSLVVSRGSIFGFLGPNGAGKTTTMKMLVGINRPDSGLILINKESPLDPKTRQEIGFMPEEPHFYDQLTGLEFLKFTNSLFKDKPQSISKLELILKKIGIYEARNKKIRNYSKGMKQRLGFGQALVNDPEYIFLDEPLDGLDPIGRIEIKVILKELKKEGRTIFFNSHILSDVENICDQIGIINQGHLIYSGSINEFKKDISLEEQFIRVIKQQS